MKSPLFLRIFFVALSLCASSPLFAYARSADPALSSSELSALQEEFQVALARRLPFPYHYAVPAGVMRAGELNMGCTEIMSPWGDAIISEEAA